MKPLAGTRVLDFSRVLAGPMATQILAELGAEVIKVERPGSGDESRSYEPKFPGGESGYYFAFNRAKRSITLDLKNARGRDIARRLAGKADVLVENFLPGAMDRMGLGYAALSAENPRLVYVSNTGFGQSGPYRDRNGYDTIFQALSGVMDLTGHPDGPPAKVGVPFADLTSGLWIAMAAMTGLLGRANTGKGAHVDVAMMDVQVSLLTIAAARYFALGETPHRTGTEHPGRVPSAAFQCRDGGWLHISGSDQHWARICKVLGLDDLAADRALDDNAVRVAQRERVMAAMRSAVAAQDRTPLAEALRAAGVPAGEVNSVSESIEDPHIQARGVVGSFDHPVEGSVRALRTPLRFEGLDDPEIGTPPGLGADTDAILSEELGLGAGEIAELRQEGAI
ncbi:crotonobetainyl-CoA:carnitine CoA-transferase CaiB-like acyl-CoA transferase [Amorphus suaedae]